MKYFIAICLLLSLGGCGVFQKPNEEYSACGAQSITVIAQSYGIVKSQKFIEDDIKERKWLLKRILSIFDRSAVYITFPDELEHHLDVMGLEYEIIKTGDLHLTSRLIRASGKRAIALVNKRGRIDKFHWATIPTTKSGLAEDYYGSSTVVWRIYLITKPKIIDLKAKKCPEKSIGHLSRNRPSNTL